MIRKARPSDDAHVVPLLYAAMGDIAHTLTGTGDKADALAIMRAFFRREGNRLSFENALVDEIDGIPVGFALFYHGSRTAELDAPFVSRLTELRDPQSVAIAKEAQDDEFYLDSMAVAPPYQGRGIAKALMAAFEAESARRGHDRVALLVGRDNSRARALYEAQGYQKDAQLEVSGHLYDHMVKRVAAT